MEWYIANSAAVSQTAGLNTIGNRAFGTLEPQFLAQSHRCRTVPPTADLASRW